MLPKDSGLSALLAFVILLTHVHYAHAFFPVQWREYLVGNGGVSHTVQTRQSFELLAQQYFPYIPSLTQSMVKARDAIADANAGVDKDQEHSALHFDGENFQEGQSRLTDLMGKTVDALNSNKASDARSFLGQALHTVQDFYSHSNWIEMGNLGPNQVLGRGGSINAAGPTDPTCVGCSGLDLSQWIIGTKIGICLDCSSNEKGLLTQLTSGYYFGEDRTIPDKKCHHGGPFDNGFSEINGVLGEAVGGVVLLATGIYRTGINKDSLACQWSPHYGLHRDAVDAAVAATSQYINDLKGKITTDELRQLFGVGSLFSFVMDTTGSMADIQQSVAQQAEQIAADRASTSDAVDYYVISPFNDPDTGPVTIVTGIDSFDAYMNGLTASGGGDCPELSLTGILNAIDAVNASSQLFMFTDAAPKDFDLEDAVVEAAIANDVNINIFKFDSNCDDGLTKRTDSLSNSVYASVCARTGGSYHSLPRNQVGSISGLLDTLTSSATSPILRIADFANSSAEPAGTYTFPVDSSMSRVSLYLSGTAATMKLKASGSLARSNVTETDLNDGSFITVVNPPPGKWSVSVNATGNFTLLVTGASKLYFTKFDFVESTGRGGHGGYFPIDGPPPHNVDIGIIAELFGNFTSAKFDLRTLSGHEIMSLPVNAGSGKYGDPSTDSFFGVVRIPDEDCLAYASGIDANGQPFQRLITTPISPIISNTTYRIGTLDPLPEANITLKSSTTSTSHSKTSTKSTSSRTKTTSTSCHHSSSTPHSKSSSSIAVRPTKTVSHSSSSSKASSSSRRVYSVTEIICPTSKVRSVTIGGTKTHTTVRAYSTSTKKVSSHGCLKGTYTSWVSHCHPTSTHSTHSTTSSYHGAPKSTSH